LATWLTSAVFNACSNLRHDQPLLFHTANVFRVPLLFQWLLAAQTGHIWGVMDGTPG